MKIQNARNVIVDYPREMSHMRIFHEMTRQSVAKPVLLSHLSVELGHLNAKELSANPLQLRHHFEQIALWMDSAQRAFVGSVQLPRTRYAESNQEYQRAVIRISTCLLIDDYFTPRCGSPAELVPLLVMVAREAGLEIDYLARESGCVDADGVPLARLLESHLLGG